MNSVFRKTMAMSLAALLGVSALTGCGSKKEEAAGIDGTKTVMTVNGEEIPLGVASFYTRYDQTIEYQYIQMYQMYGLNYSFDTVLDEESGETMGQTLKKSLMEELQKQIIVSQHAGDYNIALTDDEKNAIAEVVKAYVENNSEDVRAKVGASEADLTKLLEVQTLVSDMRDPIVADVDTTVTDEEAQQTTLTYVSVPVPEELPVESGAESVVESAAAVVTAESVLEAASSAESVVTDSVEASVVNAANDESTGSAVVTESGAESLAESTVEEVYEEPAAELQAVAEAKAQQVLDLLKQESDVAAMGTDAITAVAAQVDDTLYAEDGQFTRNDTADTTLDANVVEAAMALADGELCDTVVKSEDGTAYYVIRLNKVFDEDATDVKKTDIVISRKEAKYDEVVSAWVEEAKVSVDEDVWAAVEVKDSELFTLAPAPQTEAESEAAAVESVVESTVESAAEANTNGAEPLASDVLSGAESAASAVESAVSAVESIAE
ncbi:MAG: hypothetical protein Q4B09_01270 [Lachnospiraceae bacterium]|nr:hypothetical protein [Lachnospiraceae bacterium]